MLGAVDVQDVPGEADGEEQGEPDVSTQLYHLKNKVNKVNKVKNKVRRMFRPSSVTWPCHLRHR